MSKEFARKFYNSKRWHNCRNSYISERIMIDGGMCEKCNEKIGEELHHKIFLNPMNINDPEITLKFDNLIWLCKDCHFQEHREAIIKGFLSQKKKHILNNGYYFDDNGTPQPQRIFIVYGAPASGKTTYVKKHKQYGDLICDLDLIEQAICMCSKSDIADNLLNVALEIRDTIYKCIEENKVDCKNIWIIACLPKADERKELSLRLSAELIFIEAEYSECLKRIDADNERENKVFQKYLVDKWFENYQA